jgi:hypothetical protein
MAYTFSKILTLGAGETGLTLTAALFDTEKVSAAGLSTTEMSEVAAGSGTYIWAGTIPDSHRGYITFSDGATFKAAVSVNPEEAENTDVKTSTRTSSSATWAVLTSSGLSSDNISAVRGDSWSIDFTNLGDISSRTKLWFTLKSDPEGADSTALVQIEETAGLLYLDGAAGTAGQGDITVSDAAAGDISVILAAVASAQVDPGIHYTYDVQMLAGTTVTTMASGKFEVTTDRTRATS